MAILRYQQCYILFQKYIDADPVLKKLEGSLGSFTDESLRGIGEASPADLKARMQRIPSEIKFVLDELAAEDVDDRDAVEEEDDDEGIVEDPTRQRS